MKRQRTKQSMHTETKQITHKNMRYVTLAEKSKATTKPWSPHTTYSQEHLRSGSILEHTRTYPYLLTAPDPRRAFAI